MESFEFTDDEMKDLEIEWEKLIRKSNYSIIDNPELCIWFYEGKLEYTDDRVSQSWDIIKKMNNFRDIKLPEFMKHKQGLSLKTIICKLKHEKGLMLFDIVYNIKYNGFKLWLFFIIDGKWMNKIKVKDFDENEEYKEIKDIRETIREDFTLSLLVELPIAAKKEIGFFYSKFGKKTYNITKWATGTEEWPFNALFWFRAIFNDRIDKVHTEGSKGRTQRMFGYYNKVEIKLDEEYGVNYNDCVSHLEKNKRPKSAHIDPDSVHNKLIPLYGTDEQLHGYIFSKKLPLWSSK